MLNAIIDGQISAPVKKGRATCPLCSGRMIAKCGAHVTHHWAHEATTDCDPWSEPEGEWHRAWKSLVRPEQREVTMGPHRADIVTASGQVVELQHSSISAEEIAERCAFYHPMVWIFDVSKAYAADRLAVEWGEPRSVRASASEIFRPSYGKRPYRATCHVCIGTGMIHSKGDCRECPGIPNLVRGNRSLPDGIKQSYRCTDRTCAGLPVSTRCQCLGRGVDVVGDFCRMLWKQARLDWTYAKNAGERVLLDCGPDGELVEVLSFTDRRRERNRLLNHIERHHLMAQVRIVRRAAFIEWMTDGKPEMSNDELHGVDLVLKGMAHR